MIVELHGAGFRNKGAQLMLLTVCNKLRSLGGVEVCMEALPGDSAEQRQTYGIRPIRPSVRPFARAKPVSVFFRLSRVAGRALPPSSRYARRQDPQALIDISGFAFGDDWGWRRTHNFARRAAWYRRHGKPVVMLPQMLGPFEDADVATAFRGLLDATDRVFARDRISLDAVRGLGGRDQHVTLAPDLTIFGGDKPPIFRPSEQPRACVVPNVRMLDRGGNQDLWRPIYLDRLERAARVLLDQGLRVEVVVHDAGEDRPLAEELVRRLAGEPVGLFEHSDPLALKGFLGGSRVVVGSRFHALVAALSMGVPALALGWSHKYEMLVEDFDLAGMTYGPEEPEDALVERVRVLAGDGREDAHRKVVEARERMRPVNEAMWSEVAGLLGLGAR